MKSGDLVRMDVDAVMGAKLSGYGRDEPQPQKGLRAEDIVVTQEMINVGMVILEETGDTTVISDFRLERAFRAMCLCAWQSGVLEDTAPTE